MSFNLVSSAKRLVPVSARRSYQLNQLNGVSLRRELGTVSGGNVEISAVSLSEVILNNYKAQSRNLREDILEHMTNESLAFLEHQERASRLRSAFDNVMSSSVQSVVDDVYELLEPYISKLNQSLAGTALAVSCTPPALVTETLHYDTRRQPLHTVTSYRARISTCRLSVVMRGKDNAVDFFLLPVEKVMGLSRVESEHKPIMSFTAVANCGFINWEVEGKPLTYERMERYCLLLFDHLIQETRAELHSRDSGQS